MKSDYTFYKAQHPLGYKSYVSDKYQLEIYTGWQDGPFDDVVLDSDMIWMSFKRRDKDIIQSREVYQKILDGVFSQDQTNMVLFEVFPPESRLVDAANQYHLWGGVMKEGTRTRFSDFVRVAMYGPCREIDIRKMRDWRKIQDRKNKTVGVDESAVQMFIPHSPATNHITVVPGLFFGFQDRIVMTPEEVAQTGAKQRPLCIA